MIWNGECPYRKDKSRMERNASDKMKSFNKETEL